MKRLLAFALLLALGLGLAACGTGTKHAKVTVGGSEQFEEKEVQAAVDLTLDEFEASFEGCRLKTLAYDEEQSRRIAQLYITNPASALYGMDPDNVIVLISEFKAVADTGTGLEKNKTYTDWTWFYIRENKDAPWQQCDPTTALAKEE